MLLLEQRLPSMAAKAWMEESSIVCPGDRLFSAVRFKVLTTHRRVLSGKRDHTDALALPVLQADHLPGDGTYVLDAYIISSLLGRLHIVAAAQPGSADQVG